MTVTSKVAVILSISRQSWFIYVGLEIIFGRCDLTCISHIETFGSTSLENRSVTSIKATSFINESLIMRLVENSKCSV